MERKRASREEWVAWARDVTCDASARAIAARIGRSHTTVSRWLRDGGSADAVIAIAVGYGAPVVRSLVEMGYLSPEEAERVNVSDMLRTLPNVALTNELHRRAIAFRRIYGKDTVE